MFSRTKSELIGDNLDLRSTECVEEAEQEIPASSDDWCGDDIFMCNVPSIS